MNSQDILIEIFRHSVRSGSASEFLLRLSTHGLADFGCLGGLLCRLQAADDLVVIGHYFSHSLSQDLPPLDFAKSFFSNKTSVVAAGFSNGEEFPLNFPRKVEWITFLTEPISGSVGIGALCFNETIDKVPKDLARLLAVASEKFVSDGSASNTSVAGLEKMTSRQKEVLSLMTTGLTNYQIARKLNISESTVKQETIKIYRQLGVASREGAIDLANRATAH